MIVMLTEDRPLKVKLKEGKSAITDAGLIDNRIFTGDNKIHAVMDTETTLWSLKYEKGHLPEKLRQKFTSFPRLFKYAKDYFARRNIELTEDDARPTVSLNTK